MAAPLAVGGGRWGAPAGGAARARRRAPPPAARRGGPPTPPPRRYRDKADLPSAAIDSLRQPTSGADSGDARRDLVAHLDNARRNFDMSLAGTLLMEERHDPRLMELFRERMVLPRRQVVRDTIQHGIERGQIRSDVDLERVLDLLLGALFAAVLATGRPDQRWAERTVAAVWPALERAPAGRS